MRRQNQISTRQTLERQQRAEARDGVLRGLQLMDRTRQSFKLDEYRVDISALCACRLLDMLPEHMTVRALHQALYDISQQAPVQAQPTVALSSYFTSIGAQ